MSNPEISSHLSQDEIDRNAKIDAQVAQFEEQLKDQENLSLFDSEQLIHAGLVIADTLGRKGSDQLHKHVIVGEDEAVEATLVTQLIGGNVHYVSMHGGGKTKLLRFGHLIISGINRIATTPARADLKGGEFTGSHLPLVIRETDKNGLLVAERNIENTAEGIVNGGTQVLSLNELPRISPFAINAGLEIMEAKELEGPKGIVKLDELEYITATSNPFTKASRQNQFRAHTAGLSRFQQAVVMGDEKYWDEITEAISVEEWDPTPQDIVPVISLRALHVARKAIRTGIILPQAERQYLKNVSISAARVLRNELNAEELPGRINVHIRETSKAMAALKGDTHVSQETINRALGNKVTAIAVGLRPKDEAEIYSVIDLIKEQAV